MRGRQPLTFDGYGYQMDTKPDNQMRARQPATYDGYGYQMDANQMYGYRYFAKRCAECHKSRETFGGELVSLIKAMQHWLLVITCKILNVKSK